VKLGDVSSERHSCTFCDSCVFNYSDEEDERGTDFNNAVYFTRDAAAAAAVDTTQNDEVKTSHRLWF